MRTTVLLFIAALIAIVMLSPEHATFKQRWQPVIDHPLHVLGTRAGWPTCVHAVQKCRIT